MIPEVGKFYHFWDDGKCGLSRHYIAKVEKIIPFELSGNMFFEFEDRYVSLMELWKDQVEDCNWLYSKETDYFIECSIPKYYKNPIYFVRDKNNKWFSIATTNWLQDGRLDVDESIYEEVLKNSSYELKERHKSVEY